MAYTQTITEANDYFSDENHVQAFDWANYTTKERKSALAQAQRELEVFLNRPLYDPTSSLRYRDDYAHFEQSLFILENTRRTRESNTGAEMVETVDSENRDKFRGVTISPMALRYLAIPRIKTTRG